MCGLPSSANFVFVAGPFRGYGPYVQVPGAQVRRSGQGFRVSRIVRNPSWPSRCLPFRGRTADQGRTGRTDLRRGSAERLAPARGGWRHGRGGGRRRRPGWRGRHRVLRAARLAGLRQGGTSGAVRGDRAGTGQARQPLAVRLSRRRACTRPSGPARDPPHRARIPPAAGAVRLPRPDPPARPRPGRPENQGVRLADSHMASRWRCNSPLEAYSLCAFCRRW